MFNYRECRSGCRATGVVSVAFVGLILGASVNPADAGGFGDDNQGCAVNVPCITGYQSGNKVIFRFDSITGWDVYHVRYKSTGGGEVGKDNTSGHFTFNNTLPNRVYTLSVQGCHKHLIGHDECSGWTQGSVTTR
jgi:hypothetical protein